MKGSLLPSDITLGILAGGRASRLGGLDKAWLERSGVPQVLRIARLFAPVAGRVLVSANRELDRYAGHGLDTVVDRIADAGPLGGLDALAQACTSPWLLTLPVDLISANESLLPRLVAADGQGAYAEDDDGLQPLVALWRVDLLRTAAVQALDAGDLAIQALQARLDMARVRFTGVRFGNLNTHADLTAAGFVP